jgi:hypothetical protein
MKYKVFTNSFENLKLMSKKIILLLTLRQAQGITLCFLLLTLVVNAQTPPNAFNYSAVARNTAGQPIATTTIGIQITILKTSPAGVSQYSENHFVNTDAFGLFNLVIGAGAVQSGSMSTIDWSNDNYYLKVGMDAAGGTNFLTMGTTQLLSVPYALYARNSGFTIVNDNTNLLYDASNSGSYYKTFILNIPSTNFITFGKIRIFDANNQQIAPDLYSEGLNSISILANNAVVISRMEIPILTINGWKLHVETF